MKITISKSQWEQMGKMAGWLDEESKSPKMMPGQTPYTPEELEKLQGLVSGAAEGDPGEQAEREMEIQDARKSRRRFIRVTFNDGDVVETEINGTKAEIEDYYLNQGLTDTYDEKRLHKPVKVEFLK